MNPDPLRDPDTDSEPWPTYAQDQSGLVVVALAVGVPLAVLIVFAFVVLAGARR